MAEGTPPAGDGPDQTGMAGAGPQSRSSRRVAQRDLANVQSELALVIQGHEPATRQRRRKQAAQRAEHDQPEAPQDVLARARTADFEAELAIVAALLTTPETYFDVYERVAPEDFSDARLSEVLRAIIACDNAGKPFDKITVGDELRRAKALDRVGGRDALDRIIERGSPLVTNVISHCDLVADLALKRRVVLAGRDIAASGLEPDADGKTALASAEEKVFALSKIRERSTLREMAQIVPGVVDLISKGRHSLLLGHSTGLTDLDRMTAGLRPGQLITIGARPGMGKSSLALTLAKNIAQSTQLMVPYLSWEMTTTELATRMLATIVGISSTDLRQGSVPTGADRDIAIALQNMSALSVLIDDQPPPTIGGVRSAMRRLARRGQIGAIVVDYLQLMDSDRHSRDPNRVQEISDISRGLKRLASELDVPILACSQLSRNVESRADRRPVLADLRDSGSIEQDSSLVWFLYREHFYNEQADPNLTELIIAKQRDGATGTVYLHFQPEATRFSDWHGPAPRQLQNQTPANRGQRGRAQDRPGAPF